MKHLVLVLSLLAVALPVHAATISPLDYGAKCNGVVDDTAALRAAIAAADKVPSRKLSLHCGKLLTTDTVIFGGRTDRYSTISVEGAGEYDSAIIYAGPMDRPALVINHMAAFTWAGFSVTTPQAANFSTHGTSIGVLVTGPGTFNGTADTLMSLNHVLVSGFKFGMLVGDVNAGSELECRNCNFQYNDIGWTANGYNSLNFWFYNLGLGGNRVGIKLGGPWVTQGVHIIGGHTFGNTVADIECANSFDNLSIRNVRAEVAAYFVKGPGCGTQFSLSDSTILGVGAAATAAIIDLSAWNSSSMRDTFVQGQVKVSSPLVIIENSRMVDAAPDYPVIWATGTSKYIFRNNLRFGVSTFPALWFTDRTGTRLNGVEQ